MICDLYSFLEQARDPRALQAHAIPAAVQAITPTRVAAAPYERVLVGAMNFAHFYFHPSQLSSPVESEFDRNMSSVTLIDQAGLELAAAQSARRGRLVQPDPALCTSGLYRDVTFTAPKRTSSST